jgi:hypothetical protein
MACTNPFDGFRVATEYLGPELYRRASFTGVMLNLIPRAQFAPNTGLTHSIFRLNNQEPTDDERAGTAISSVTSGNGACAYNFTDVTWGFQEETFTPLALGWRGPVVCKDNLFFDFRPEEFLNGYLDSITKYVQTDLENHLLYHYMRRVPIYVARQNFSTSIAANSNLTAPVATSELTQQMLDSLAIQLNYNRAIKPDSSGWVANGPEGPIYSLAIGPEASQRIVQNNSDFRNDLRWAAAGESTGSELMRRLGATRAIKNWRHMPFLLPPRFTHDGSKYVRVPTFTSSSTTKGTGTDVNSAYISPATAPYEAAIVLSPNVMTSELIAPNSTYGPASFDAQNYMGEWMWRTGAQAKAAAEGDACYDPLGKFGRHFAEFKHALRPGALPAAGAVVFYKRCSGSFDLVQCT